MDFIKNMQRRNIHVVYSACCSGISWDQPTMKMFVVFPETNQTKMPKCVDLTEGTKWQWFISFGVGFGFWKSLEIMEANECRTGDYGNLSNLSCIRRVLESANVVLC